MWIDGDAFNSVLVGRKLMSDRFGPDVNQTHIAPLASRDKYLVLWSENQTAGALVVTSKRHHQGFSLRQDRVPYADILALGTVSR